MDFNRGVEGDEFKLDETLESKALLLGRVTYQTFAAAWPSMEGEFADKLNSMPKYVASSTPMMFPALEMHYPREQRITEDPYAISMLSPGVRTVVRAARCPPYDAQAAFQVHGMRERVAGLLTNDRVTTFRGGPG